MSLYLVYYYWYCGRIPCRQNYARRRFWSCNKFITWYSRRCIRRLGICPFRTCSLGIDRKFDNFYSGGYSCIMDCFFILKIQIGILYNLFLI